MSYVIALYVRLSSEDKDLYSNAEKDESNSVTGQKNQLMAFVKSKEEFANAQVLTMVDDGFSGTNFERPKVQELLEMARENRVNCIIVKDFSRFGRTYLEVSDYVDQIFPFLGIRFISINDNYDSANSNGKTSGLEVAFRNIIYGYYSRDLSVKVKTAKMTKALKGQYINAHPPFGYRKQKDNKHKLEIEPMSAEIVKRAFEMACNGMTTTQIAIVFNTENVAPRSTYKNNIGIYHNWPIVGERVLWNHNIISSILRDERYLGKVIFNKRYRTEVGKVRTVKNPKDNWVVVDNMHEPLVSEEDFYNAQEVMKAYVEKDSVTTQKIHLFTRKLRCNTCGHLLSRRKNGRYCCYSHSVDPNSVCIKKGITETEVAETVFKALEGYLKSIEQSIKKKKQTKSEVSKLQKQVKMYENTVLSCKNQKADTYDKKANAEISEEEYLRIVQELTEKQNGFENLIKELSDKILLQEQAELQAEFLPKADVLSAYLKSKTLTREMVEHFVNCVYVNSDLSIHIEWKFEGIKM